MHPVGVPPRAFNVASTGRGGKDLQGMPGTAASLILRVCQFALAVVSFSIMSSVADFDSVTAFCYLVVATIFQSIWSLMMGILDCYSVMYKRTIRKTAAIKVFAIGDWVIATLTLAAACSSAGITVLLDKDLDQCGANDCARFEAAAAVAFLAWFLASVSFFFSFWLAVTW